MTLDNATQSVRNLSSSVVPLLRILIALLCFIGAMLIALLNSVSALHQDTECVRTSEYTSHCSYR